jgi:hypothetical protein
MKRYIVEVLVDDSSDAGADEDFIRDEIHSRLEDIVGVTDIYIDSETD